MNKHLHFELSEFKGRQQAALNSMQERGLDGLLLFFQESMYYLTGYDTTGYSQFQCLYLGADGKLILVTRSADLRQAAYTSIIDDVRIWIDKGDSNPSKDVRAVLNEQGCTGKRIGIELNAWCLTGARWEMLRAELDGYCKWQDASDLVATLRHVKSPAELKYVRKAGELADSALRNANDIIAAGIDEGAIYSTMHAATFEGGGDYPASRHIIGSGPGALMVRNFSGHRTVQDNDQVQLEFGATYRHYHACLVRVVLTGKVDPRHQAMHDACREALQASQDACRPGNRVGDVFDAHARVMDSAGFQEHRLNACGYSLSANYPPTWMEQPMFFTGNPYIIQENMVFFMHMFLLDAGNDLAMSTGESVIVKADGVERLSNMSHELVVK